MRIIETRASRERDTYRIVRVTFRPAARAWWDSPLVVSFALGVSLMWLGLVLAFAPVLHK